MGRTQKFSRPVRKEFTMTTNERLLERLATDLLLSGKADRTVKIYTAAVRQFLTRSGIERLIDVSEDDIRAYLVGLARQKMGRSPWWAALSLSKMRASTSRLPLLSESSLFEMPGRRRREMAEHSA